MQQNYRGKESDSEIIYEQAKVRYVIWYHHRLERVGILRKERELGVSKLG